MPEPLDIVISSDRNQNLQTFPVLCLRKREIINPLPAHLLYTLHIQRIIDIAAPVIMKVAAQLPHNLL